MSTSEFWFCNILYILDISSIFTDFRTWILSFPFEVQAVKTEGSPTLSYKSDFYQVSYMEKQW